MITKWKDIIINKYETLFHSPFPPFFFTVFKGGNMGGGGGGWFDCELFKYNIRTSCIDLNTQTLSNFGGIFLFCHTAALG